MKIKILRNVTLGIGCLMLTITLSSNFLNLNYKSNNNKHINIIQMDEDSPVGMIKSRHIMRPMEDSPVGMTQSINNIIRLMQG
jgi:hypothetical protein